MTSYHRKANYEKTSGEFLDKSSVFTGFILYLVLFLSLIFFCLICYF